MASRAVTILGSSSVPSSHPDYFVAEELGFALAGRGVKIVNGGGAGTMEAAAKGARRARGEEAQGAITHYFSFSGFDDERSYFHFRDKKQII
jgi:predicted Rossmann-fold nucleotide-binding protein